jgi:hypothetical protein
MPTNLDDSTIKLGQRIAKERSGTDKMFQYIRSAAAAEVDDLTMPDAWENIIHDLECALAVAQAMARRFEGGGRK